MRASLLILALALGLGADTFDVGGKRLVIPPPQGFTLVTSEMNAVYRMSQQLSDPNNKLIAYYIPDSLVPAAKAGLLPSLPKAFLFKVNKDIKKLKFGIDDFKKLKESVKAENDEIYRDDNSKTSEVMKGTSEGISKEFNVDFSAKISRMVPLGSHFESEHALAYSVYIDYAYAAAGQKGNAVVVSTVNIANVSGKVLFFYCTAPKDELKWTRASSRDWVERILAVNPPPPSRTFGLGAIDWSTNVVKAIVWGCICALITGVLGVIQKTKDKRKDKA